MNDWQSGKQLRYMLRSRVWAETGGEPVFGSVHITDEVPEDAYHVLSHPAALIHVGPASPDPEFPDLVLQDFEIDLLAQVAGDQLGEAALIGANRGSAGIASSLGRGVLEIQEEVLAMFAKAEGHNGIKIIESWKSSAPTRHLESGAFIGGRRIGVQVRCTRSRYYHPPSHLVATGGAGQVVLTWRVPPDRYDRYRVRLVRKSGSTAPASISDGTIVTLASNLATGVTNSGLSAGTYSYAIFASYDETNESAGVPAPAEDQRYSDLLEEGCIREAVVVT